MSAKMKLGPAAARVLCHHIPGQLAAMPQLKLLKLSNFGFVGNILSFEGFVHLRTLELNKNRLGGSLPSFGSCPSLERLDLSEMLVGAFILDRLRSLPTYAPAGSHACGCGWGVVQIYYLYWLVGVCAYVCVCGLCLSNGGLAPV